MALTPEFTQKVSAIEQRLGMEPGSLLSVIRFETGGTFGTDVKNRMGSGATGLIQFMPKTAKGLGTSTEALAKMSAEDQLDYVEKYLQPYKGKMSTLKDAYMAVLYPKAIGKPEWYPLFISGTKAYTQNAGLDRDKKGTVTVADAVARVRGSREATPPTMMAQAPSLDAAPQAPAAVAQAPAFTGQESTPEPPEPTTQGAHWASVLFSAESPQGAQGGERAGGSYWARVLFG